MDQDLKGKSERALATVALSTLSLAMFLGLFVFSR
jgi:hypothetical protein